MAYTGIKNDHGQMLCMNDSPSRDPAKAPSFRKDPAKRAPLQGREEELRALLKCLRIASGKVRPIQVWVSGQPGSGKTSLAQLALRKLHRPGRVDCVYVNCWKNNTFHAVLERLVTELRLLGVERIDTRFKLERLRQHIEGKALIVSLDELDRVPLKEREAMIYNLSSLGNVGLLCISYSRSAFLDMDRRVRSRLSPYILQIDAYGEDHLTEILGTRAAATLLGGSWKESDLRRIAELACGDARVAIRTLEQAAQLASRGPSGKIDTTHLEAGWRKVTDLRRRYLLDQLTNHHTLIYQVIRQKAPVASIRARQVYESLCSQQAIRPIARRTFTHYVNRLVDAGLITKDRTSSWGNVRLLRPSKRFHPDVQS